MTTIIQEHMQWIKQDGTPLVDGVVLIGGAGTDPTLGYPENPLNLITIYSDASLTTPITNPQTTDAYGRTANKIYVAGQYSIAVLDSDSVQQYINTLAGTGIGATVTNPLTLTDTDPTIYLKDSDTTDDDIEIHNNSSQFDIWEITDANGFVHGYFNVNMTTGRVNITAKSGGSDPRVVINGVDQIDLTATTTVISGDLLISGNITGTAGTENDGDVLTWVAANSQYEPLPASGGQVLLETWNATAVGTKDFVTDDYASYRELLLVGDGLTLGTNNGSLEVLVINAAGTPYTSSNYVYSNQTSVTATPLVGSAVSSWQVLRDTGNAANEGGSFSLRTIGHNSSNGPPGAKWWSCNARASGGIPYAIDGVGTINDSATHSVLYKGFRIFPQTGVFGTSGTVRFYGIPY